MTKNKIEPSIESPMEPVIETSIEELAGKQGLSTPLDADEYLKSRAGKEKIESELLELDIAEVQEKLAMEAYIAEENAKKSLLAQFKELEAEKESDQRQQEALLSTLPPATLTAKEKANMDANDPYGQESGSSNPYAGLLGKKQEELKYKEDLYENYDKQVKTADLTIDQFEAKRAKNRSPKNDQKIIKQIDKQIDKLQQEGEKHFDKALDYLDKGQDDLAHKELDKAKALNVQIASLKDYKSVITGEKVMYDKDGNRTNKIQESAYIVSKDDHLIYDHEKKRFLLFDKNHPDKYNRDSDNIAAENFQRHKSDICRVKDVISSNKDAELGELKQEINTIKTASELTALPDENRNLEEEQVQDEELGGTHRM